MVTYVDDDTNQFVALFRRQYLNSDGGADITAAMVFSIPEDLPLGQKRYKALRRRLALGPSANIAAPLMSGVAATAIAGLTSIPVAPPWPEGMAYADAFEFEEEEPAPPELES